MDGGGAHVQGARAVARIVPAPMPHRHTQVQLMSLKIEQKITHLRALDKRVGLLHKVIVAPQPSRALLLQGMAWIVRGRGG